LKQTKDVQRVLFLDSRPHPCFGIRQSLLDLDCFCDQQGRRSSDIDFDLSLVVEV
jgi:hypothetical protein